jgi:ABC-2 type transport system ATP-binding protein
MPAQADDLRQAHEADLGSYFPTTMPQRGTTLVGEGRIEVRGLTKQYKGLTAVDGLSFTVEPGRVTGFLGPNGAGKTTTLRMLLGLVMPTSGTATIDGHRYVDLPEPSRVVGAVLEASAAHRGRTGRNHLLASCLATGLPASRAEQVLDLVGLIPAADRPFKGYSLGMRQRLGVATAMLGDPRILILDEPANGLDPEGIRWMRDLLRGLAAEGRAVLVSSHLLAEMQALADDVVILAAGRLIRQGSVTDVLAAMPGIDQVEVATPDPALLTALLTSRRATVTPTPTGTLLVSGMAADAVGDLALAHQVAVHQLITSRPDLEAAFLDLTQGMAGIR